MKPIYLFILLFSAITIHTVAQSGSVNTDKLISLKTTDCSVKQLFEQLRQNDSVALVYASNDAFLTQPLHFEKTEYKLNDLLQKVQSQVSVEFIYSGNNILVRKRN